MTHLARLGSVLAGLLVGLGIAVTARTIATVGVDHLVLGHIVGPGLVAAGLVRLKLQRMLERPAPDEDEHDG